MKGITEELNKQMTEATISLHNQVKARQKYKILRQAYLKITNLPDTDNIRTCSEILKVAEMGSHYRASFTELKAVGILDLMFKPE